METYFATRVEAANVAILAAENSLKLAEGYVAYESSELRALDLLEAIGIWARAEGLDVDRLFDRANSNRARRLEHLLPRPRAIVTVELSPSTDRWLSAQADANVTTPAEVLASAASAIADIVGRRQMIGVSMEELIRTVGKRLPAETCVVLRAADSEEIHDSMNQREVAAHV